MPARLFVIQDDLMFAQRALHAARRLGVGAQTLNPAAAGAMAWLADDVVVLQATLRPDQQLAFIDELLGRSPHPIIVAVTGHLETELRRRLKRLGVRLAAHSAMDTAVARALGLNGQGSPN